MRLDMRLSNKVAIVTGGASGIGRATAVRFAQEGARIAILDRDCLHGEEVVRQIQERGHTALFLQADISVEQQVSEAIEKTHAEFGTLNILVNNAAAFVFGSYDVSQGDWDRVLSVNVTGTALCSKYAIPAMMRAGGGSIVNVTSISGFVAQERSLPYNTSKAALLGLNRCLAMDLAPHRVLSLIHI